MNDELREIDEDRFEDATSWSRVVPSSRRQKSIEGSLFGVAVGEALGLPRHGMTRRSGLRLYGKGPLGYQLIPRIGFCGPRFHLTFSAGQSVLRSYQKQSVFVKDMDTRLRWYGATAFALLSPATTISALAVPTGVGPVDTGLLPRCLLLAAVLQGSGASGSRWIEAAMKELSKDPKLCEAGMVLGAAGQIAAGFDVRDLDRQEVVKTLIDEAADEEMIRGLEVLAECFEKKRSLQGLARTIGWSRGVPNDPIAVVLASVYAWLRHPKRFRLAVEPAIALGGQSATVGAIVGGLSGMSLGPRQIPPQWVGGLVAWPHGYTEIKQLALRLTDWPHGAEDLHRAPAMPSFPFFQCIRNCAVVPVIAGNRILRWPWSILGRLRDR